MNLIFLFGMPGVGKLTVAKELAKLTGYKVFHNHLTVDLVTSLFEFGSEPFINFREKIWLETFAEAIKAEFSGLIFTFAPEQTVRTGFPDKVRKLLNESGGNVIFVELTCEIEELENRLGDNNRAKFGKIYSVEFFRELQSKGVFEQPKIKADFSIETAKLSAIETAKAILLRLQTDYFPTFNIIG